jgi:hypothetical protein
MKRNLVLTKSCLCAALAAVGALIHSANADADRNPSNEPVVQDRYSTSDAKESNDSKATIEQQQTEKWWSITMESGYETEYVFRGTNLTPNSDGFQFDQVYFSGKGLTFGVWIGAQLGTAEAGPGVTALGESGGGSGRGGNKFHGNDFAVQNKFREIDLFSLYRFPLGPIDITLGNIVFLIHRRQVEEFRLDPEFIIIGLPPILRFAAPGNETFDRIFLALSTSKIRSGGYSLTPTVTYYQTVYNHSSGPTDDYTLQNLGFIRNDELGGYLEGKIQGVIPIIDNVLRLEPFALISYSFKDRSEAVNLPPELIRVEPSSRPLTGFNHVQVGVDLVFQITKHFSVTGFGDFSHHISDPTGGTERNEWWAGGKGTISF